jgi:hypothetical protein
MKETTSPEMLRDLRREVFVTVLEEAEELLADVDIRDDPAFAPFGRFEGEVGALVHALGEIERARPGALDELEAMVERVREVGVEATWPHLRRQPHLLQVLRLSLEVFFRRHPNLESYRKQSESTTDEEPPAGHMTASPGELWRGRRKFLSALRGSLS